MLKRKFFSPPNVPCGLPLFVGLLSLFYRELPKLGMCKSKHRHCAIRLKIFGASTCQPERGLVHLFWGKGVAHKTRTVSNVIYDAGST